MTEGTGKSRRRVWRVVRRSLLVTLAIVVVAAGAYAIWGWSLSTRHAALVDELHGMGVPIWEALARDTVPEEENGVPLLVEADRIYAEFEQEIWVEVDDIDATFVGGISDEEWTDAQRESWIRAQPRIEPCFALIERAAERAAIVPEAGANPGEGGASGLGRHAPRLLWYRFLGDPESGARSVPLLLKLAASDTAGSKDPWIRRLLFRSGALRILQAGVETGAFEVAPIVDRLRVLLDGWDPVAEGRRSRLGDAMYVMWLIDEYRAGRDPLEEMFDSLDRVRGHLAEADGPDLPGGSSRPPAWLLTSWPGRPLLLWLGVGMLEHVRDRLRDDDVPDVRHGGRVLDGSDRMLLRTLAHRRLARLAVEIVAYRAETGKLPTALADLPLAAEERIDPFTGEPIRFEGDGAAVTISCADPPWARAVGDDDEGRARPSAPLLSWTVR